MKKLRAWVTPITIGSFLLIGVTGFLMFLKVRSGLIVAAHEWLSPIFVVSASLHVWLNWGAVRANLSRPRGIIIVGLFAALLALSISPGKWVEARAREHDGEHGYAQEVIGDKAASALLRARISTAAELTGRTPQQLRDILGRCGVRVASDDVTLADAARQSQVSSVRVLAAVLEEK